MIAEVLKWTIGLTSKPPEKILDTEHLLHVIRRHRLHIELFKRLKSDTPDWCTDKLLDELSFYEKETCERYKKQYEFITAFAETHFAEKPLAIVKGFTIFRIMKGKTPLRNSNDLDVFFSDPHIVKNKLENEGFLEIKKETGHELSELKKENIIVDLHKYLPVYQYPNEIWHEANKDTTCKGFELKNKIYYEDILENSIELSQGLVVPNHEMSIIIMSVAMFRDFVCFFDYIPPLKLVEVVEVYELTQLPEFRSDRLLELAIRFDATHAIEFMGYIIANIYGKQPFIESFPNPKTDFPQLVLWHFNTWYRSNVLQNLLEINSIHSLVEQFSPTIVKASYDEHIHFYCNDEVSAVKGDQIVRGIEKSTVDNPNYVRFSVMWKDGLRLLLHIHSNINADDLVVASFGDYKKEVKGFDIIEGKYEVVKKNEGDYLVIDIETAYYPKLLELQGISLFLFVEQKKENDIKSSLFPLHILKEY